MRYKLFGKSGLKVSELCLGTMTFGEDWGFGAGRDECKAIFSAFRVAGGNFIDTANADTNGTSEQIVGELVAGDRDRFVVATKYSLMQRPGDPNSSGNHRKSMVTALDASLRRLGMDYVDIYWVHAADGVTPLEELMRALDDMVRAGKVLYVGSRTCRLGRSPTASRWPSCAGGRASSASRSSTACSSAPSSAS